MFCMYIGMMSMPPIIAMKTSMPSTVLSVNMRFFSTRSCSSGSGRRTWRAMNHVSATAPTASGT